jgi:hypothetical protein
MVDFDKFEKLVKQKYGEQEFEFDEANWNKARQMIDASRKDKNRGGFWLIASVTVMITTGLVYYFGFNGSTDINENKVAVNEMRNNELALNSNETLKPQENSPVNNSVSENETVTNETTGKTNSNSASSEITRQTSNLNNSIPNNKAGSTHSDPVKNTRDTPSATNTTTENNTAKNEMKNTSSSETNNGSNETIVKNNSKKSETVKAGKKNNIPPVLGNNSGSNPNAHANSASGNSTTGSTDRMGESNANNSSTTNTKGNNEPLVTDSMPLVMTSSIKPVGDNIETKLTDSSETIQQLPVDSFKLPATPVKGDGISYATNVKLEHEYKNFLYMEAGAAYLLGWNGGGHEADGFNLVAGLNFQHYFTSNISAQLGAQYSSISNLTNSTHTISTRNYDLGLEQDVTTITYTKLHYVVAPVKISITVRKDNILGIGCNVGYLLNSDSKKEKYTVNNNNSTKNNLKSTKEKGYVQGFDPFDIQVSTFYRRKLYKGFGVNAEFIYGLTDVKKNDFFKNNSFDRNVGFKVTLCYDLFKK